MTDPICYLQGIGNFASITPNPSRSIDSQIIAFNDRFVAEKLFYGPADIPGVGKVEFSWVANQNPTSSKSAPDRDGDVSMGNEDGEGDGEGRVGMGGDARTMEGGLAGAGGTVVVDYDVADDEDDRWDGIE